jgi:hypothetical protein
MKRRFLILAALAFAAGALAAAPLPDYVREALARFRADPAQGWAYTLTVDRNGQRSVQRFDPSRPAAERWTLVSQDDHPPTADELARYRTDKARDASPPARATFGKEDIDRTTAEVLREDPQRVVVRFRFNEDAADKTLGHLALDLIVAKRPAAVEAYTLRLLAPYSPVLAVKTLELEAGTRFGTPGSPQAGLPVSATSHYVGRMLFKTVTENLSITYSDYTPVAR